MKMNQIDELSSEITALENAAREKKMMREQLRQLDSPYILAIAIHSHLCHYNHTDGCSWHYAKDTDPAAWKTDTTRKQYLEMAKRVLQITDFKTATAIVESLGLR